MDCCWCNLLIINAVLGIAALEFAFYKTRVLFDGNEERDKKYPAFRRHDLQYWKRWRLYPVAATLLIPRIIGAVLILLSVIPFCLVAGIGQDHRKPPEPWRVDLYFKFSAIWAMCGRFIAGSWYTWTHVTDVDYSYYLGPTWREELNARKIPAPTVVQNHNFIFDNFFTFRWGQQLSFVGKSGLKKILGIGRWVVGIQMIFVDRTASKEELKKTSMAIE